MNCGCNKPKKYCGNIPVRTCCSNPSVITRSEFYDYKNDMKQNLDDINRDLVKNDLKVSQLETETARLDAGKQNKLIAGHNITLTDNPDKTTTITATGSAGAYYAGDGIDITNNEISANDTIQRKLTAGSGVNIDANNVISATATEYTAGDNIEISSTNEISAIIPNVYGFDSVADMKASTELKVGDYAKTAGYYAKSDGGEANYKITDTQPSRHYETLSSGLFAELIYSGEANVKQFGAYGDKTHDDADAIQAAFDTGCTVYMPRGKYLTSKTINVTKRDWDTDGLVLRGSEAIIIYNGEDFALNLIHLTSGQIDISGIISRTGGDIKMYSSSSSDFIQYVTINFKFMQAGEGKDCVYAGADNGGWVNEVIFTGGRFYGNAENNFHLKPGASSWYFYNIGFEGGLTCVYFDNENVDRAMGYYVFRDCRHSVGEGLVKIIKAGGEVKEVFVYYPMSFNFSRVDVNDRCNNWYVYSTNNIGSHLVNGKWQFSKVIKTLEGGTTVSDNTDFNNLTTPGDYSFTTPSAIATAINKPVTNIQGKLTVQKFGDYAGDMPNRIVQTYLTFDGVEFTRAFNATKWGAWTLPNQCSEMLIPENTNLNDLTTGSFFCNTTARLATLSNTPAGVAELFRLDIKRIVTSYDGSDTCQQLIVDRNNNMYTRINNGGWSAWKKITSV